MKTINTATILGLIVNAGLEAMLVGEGDAPGPRIRLKNLRVVERTLYADDVIFLGVALKVTAVVLMLPNGRELARSDDIVKLITSPLAGDVSIHFTQGIITL
jgi:hypothetical protein